eukprot:2150872-Pyramimonas_sp.AAC.1
MLARIQNDWGCLVMDLDPEHAPKAASSWHSRGRCRPYACSEQLRASAGTSTLADQPDFQSF